MSSDDDVPKNDQTQIFEKTLPNFWSRFDFRRLSVVTTLPIVPNCTHFRLKSGTNTEADPKPWLKKSKSAFPCEISGWFGSKRNCSNNCCVLLPA